MTSQSVLTTLRRVNSWIGLACGAVLVVAVAVILLEIIMRRVAFGLIGGTDEIAGYVMAGVVSWSAAYALIERAHIRVDLLHRKLPTAGKALVDIACLAALAATSVVVAIYGFKVLARSVAQGATANTPLETPLWIPQSIWLAGWIWFALASLVLLGLALFALWRRDFASVTATAGPDSEEAALAKAVEEPAQERTL